MRFTILFAGIAVLASACSSEARTNRTEPQTIGADEFKIRQDILDKVKQLFDNCDFTGLSNLEKDYRLHRSLTPSGTWKLFTYYSQLEWQVAPKGREDGCVLPAEQFLNDWIKSTPTSPAPHILKASALDAKAWCVRGSGYAHTVSDRNMQQFLAALAQAEATLLQYREIAVTDPHYFAVMARIYRGLGRSPVEYRSMLDEATEREPNYHAIYFEAFRYYQPQWFGEPGDIDRLARYAVARTRADHGQSLYTRLYWYILGCNCLSDYATLDWSTMKAGMADMFERYPTDWNAANLAKIACEQQDFETAAIYLAKIKQAQPAAWPSAFLQQACEQSVRLIAQR